MASAAYLASTRIRETLGRRGMAAVLALLVEALIALLLLFMAPDLPGVEDGARTTTFDVSTGDSEEAAKQSRAKAAPERASRSQPKPQPVRPPEVRPRTPPLPTPPIVLPNGILPMTRQEYRSADIAKLPSRAQAPGAEAGSDSGEVGSSGGRMPGDSEVAGKAPNGEPLYAAQWYRRPTRAELSTYMSSRARTSGWGLIACRTVARYHVEDCQELGESPRGSGLAGSVRQAAFQFLVRPPRVGGKEMVGAWVSIRIDYEITRE
jgi:hypothetical protein